MGQQVYGVPHDYDVGLFNPLLTVLNVTDVWTRSEFIKIDVPWVSQSSSPSSPSSSSPSSSSSSSSANSKPSLSFSSPSTSIINDGNSEEGSSTSFSWSIQPGTFSRLARVTLTAPANRNAEVNAPSGGSMHSIHGTEGHQGIVYVKTTANSQPFEFPVSLQGVDNIVFTHPTEIDFGTIIRSRRRGETGRKSRS